MKYLAHSDVNSLHLATGEEALGDGGSEMAGEDVQDL